MNEKRTALLTVCLLGAFLLDLLPLGVPEADDAFSQSERRKLTQKPSCTVKSIYSGRYMSDFETYAPSIPLAGAVPDPEIPDQSLSTGASGTPTAYIWRRASLPSGVPHAEDSIAHAARRFDYLYDTYLSGTNCRLYLSVTRTRMPFWPPPTVIRRWTTGPSPKACGKRPLPHLSADRRSAVAGGLLPHRPPLAAGAADGRGCPPAGGDGGRSPRHLPGGDSAHPLLRRVLWLRRPAHGAGHHPLSHQRHLGELHRLPLRDRPDHRASTMGRRAPGGTPTSGSSPGSESLLTVENPHAARNGSL